jgi:hypothetical protein
MAAVTTMPSMAEHMHGHEGDGKKYPNPVRGYPIHGSTLSFVPVAGETPMLRDAQITRLALVNGACTGRADRSPTASSGHVTYLAFCRHKRERDLLRLPSGSMPKQNMTNSNSNL